MRVRSGPRPSRAVAGRRAACAAAREGRLGLVDFPAISGGEDGGASLRRETAFVGLMRAPEDLFTPVAPVSMTISSAVYLRTP